MKLNNNKPIKFAIVGCGRISVNHIEAIKALKEDAILVGICDTDQEKLEATFSQSPNVKKYSSLNVLLEEKNIDIVSLCTPSGLHPQQAIQAAKAGKHVLSEKPMSTNWHEGLRMVNECEKAQVQLFVVKQNRLNPTIELVKRALDEGRFGKIYNVAVNVFWTRPQDYYSQAKWRGTKELDGGALMNQASHYVDLLVWLFGPVSEVFAFCATQARKIEMEDSAAVTLKWKSGALGTLNVSMLTYPKNLEGSITIIGEKGTAKIGGMALNEILVWDFKEKFTDDAHVKSNNYAIQSVYGNGHALYYKNVVNSLTGSEKTKIDGREGLKSLQLLCAMYASAQGKEAITIVD